MNRMKKEAKKKYDEARKGLSVSEIAALNREESRRKTIKQLAHKLHVKNFPEEWDFMGDSILDAKERARGINPMSAEYIERIRTKREKQGVSPLSDSGMSTSDETAKLCEKEVEEKLRYLGLLS